MPITGAQLMYRLDALLRVFDARLLAQYCLVGVGLWNHKSCIVLADCLVRPESGSC